MGDSDLRLTHSGASPENEASSGAADAERPLLVRSEEIMRGRKELWIEHDGEVYRLRLTSRGKLYLTK